jgi:hypothetical protein
MAGQAHRACGAVQSATPRIVNCTNASATR